MDMLRKRLGEYYIVEHLGSGGMAHVYLALNPRTKDKRAVKIMIKRATTSPIAYARFLREVEIIRGLVHPHIIRITDSGVLDDCYYYMMDYMPGGSLAHKLARGRLPIKEVIRYFIGICDAMAYAHGRNIIHRDLKPANILLNSSAEPVVSDFGIARAIDSTYSGLTKSKEVMGTIAYLAPEQRIDTKRVDRRADVYALGTLRYEMIMGFPPLGKFPWPRETQPDFPKALERIIEICLALDPADRYSHAGLLLKDLSHVWRSMRDPASARMEDARPGELDRAVTKQQKGTERIEEWLQVLQSGTTRERLAVVREITDKVDARELDILITRFAGENDRVRWGLILVFGELRIPAACPLLLAELDIPLHRECAIEALGKIGTEQAFEPILNYLSRHREAAATVLMPLALTGKERAIPHLKGYLSSPLASLRSATVRAIAAIASPQSLSLLKEHLAMEADEKVRSGIRQSIQALRVVLFNPGTQYNPETEILPPP
jgi:HEAT repeat protein